MFNLKGRPFIEAVQADIEQQPLWRVDSAKAEAYYDGRQLDGEVVRVMEERGQPVIIVNLMNAAINGVLGNEAKTRRDVMVRADDTEGAEVSEGLNEKLNEAARISQINRAVADAYSRQVKAGIGWGEVRRNADPFGNKYIAEDIDWREISWDWSSKRPDLKDARWVARERWFDEDQALLMFPNHHDLIKNVFNDWEELNANETIEQLSPDLYGAFETETRAYSPDKASWFNYARKQIRVTQIYYRVYEKGLVIISGENVAKFDKQNREHVALVMSNKARVEWANFTVMKCAWYLGCHKLHDGNSPYPHDELPWVPFWGYREGDTRIPYGIAKLMMSAQDEYNFRRSVLTWILKARRIIMDDDATDMSHDEVLEEVAKSDGLIVLNAARQNTESGSAFKIDSDLNIAQQQFQVMQDAKNLIQDAGGVYPSFLGQEGDGVKSGIAIASLVEQGSVTLSEINDNYSYGRQKMYELLLALVVEDIGDTETSVVINKNANVPTKTIVLNGRDKANTGKINNSVALTKTHVVLADIQTTAGFRAQAQDRLVNISQSLPDEGKIAILPAILELSDLPNKHDTLLAIKRAMNMPIDPSELSEDELKQYQAQQQEQAALKKMDMEHKELDLQTKRLDVQEREAKIGKTKAESQFTGVKAVDVMTDIKLKEQSVEFNDDDKTNELMAQMNNLFAQMPTAEMATA